MTKRTVAIGLVLAALTRTASAQTSTPQPSPEDPRANPGRPTISAPATLTPVGYLQLENGVLFGRLTHGGSSLTALSQVTKLAVTSRLQLIGQFAPAAWSTNVGPSATSAYVGGISAGAQALVVPGRGPKPSVAVGFFQTAFAGSAPDLDIGSARQSVLALFSADLGAFHVDTNAVFNDQLDDSRKLQYGQTLSIAHPLGPTTVVGEFWHFTQPFIGRQAAGMLWALSYATSPHLVLDVGFNKGLTDTSTPWEGFGGFTYLVPHRLWATRHP